MNRGQLLVVGGLALELGKGCAGLVDHRVLEVEADFFDGLSRGITGFGGYLFDRGLRRNFFRGRRGGCMCGAERAFPLVGEIDFCRRSGFTFRGVFRWVVSLGERGVTRRRRESGRRVRRLERPRRERDLGRVSSS